MDRLGETAIRPESVTITEMLPTPLASIDYPAAETANRLLKAAIIERETSDPGVRYSDDGGW